MTEMTAEGYAVRKALGLAPEADGADVLAEIGWLQQSATPPPAGSGECQECDGTGTTYSAGYYVPGEQFVEPPTGPDMCESCNGTGRIPAPPPAGDGFAWARAQLAQGQSEGGELAEWADALEANAQDMRDGFEASEPDIRNAASAIRAHRCQPSAATAPPPEGEEAFRGLRAEDRAVFAELNAAANLANHWDRIRESRGGLASTTSGCAVLRKCARELRDALHVQRDTTLAATPPAAPAAAVDRDALVRAFMAAERVHSDRWRYLPERADWAEAEAMADVALAEIERQRGES